MGKDYDTEEEEDIESEDYSNLRKMVKAEIENCSKEQLLASTETKKETAESTLNDTEMIQKMWKLMLQV